MAKATIYPHFSAAYTAGHSFSLNQRAPQFFSAAYSAGKTSKSNLSLVDQNYSLIHK
ncbi:hypothetical protein [Neptunomonas qingdaonensis]|uniref:hypothetical protein n=1 Tax=Neptunomonas qingdaonensis TaxID=1045558 RepID=UPI0015A555D7|nr:hypothetical protein [Neptunomonas qingdaonensis]